MAVRRSRRATRCARGPPPRPFSFACRTRRSGSRSSPTPARPRASTPSSRSRSKSSPVAWRRAPKSGSRLGRARERVGERRSRPRDAFLRAWRRRAGQRGAARGAACGSPISTFSHGDGARAEPGALERLADRKHADVALRRAEARLLQNDLAGAREALEGLDADPTDGRAALVRGRALAIGGRRRRVPAALDPRDGARCARRGRGARLRARAWLPTDEAMRARIRTVVEGRGAGRARAGRRRSRGPKVDRDEARAALVAAVRKQRAMDPQRTAAPR